MNMKTLVVSLVLGCVILPTTESFANPDDLDERSAVSPRQSRQVLDSTPPVRSHTIARAVDYASYSDYTIGEGGHNGHYSDCTIRRAGYDGNYDKCIVEFAGTRGSFVNSIVSFVSRTNVLNKCTVEKVQASLSGDKASQFTNCAITQVEEGSKAKFTRCEIMTVQPGSENIQPDTHTKFTSCIIEHVAEGSTSKFKNCSLTKQDDPSSWYKDCKLPLSELGA